jgi:hypothetical protein
MPIVIQGIFEGVTTESLKAAIYAVGSSTIVNGSGDNVTIDSGGRFQFTPSSGVYLSDRLYEVALLKRSDGSRFSTRDRVWIASTDGTFTADSIDELDAYLQNKQQFPPQVRSIDDVAPLFFVWPGGSGKSLSAQRSINGGTLVNTDGAVTQTGVEQTTPGRYKLNYSSADRAVGSVAYKITDSADTNKTGVMAVTFLPASGAGNASEAKQDQILALLTSGQAVTNSPVSPTGTIDSPIVIGDDYLAANARAFSWTVAVPAGFTIGQASCWFGGANKTKGKWLVQGSVSAVTVDAQPRWQMAFNLTNDDTGQCKPGCYDWSVELRGPSPEHITKLRGQVELVEAYTR